MKTRNLGKLQVSELGAGCMSISANYGPPADRNQGIQVIRTAHDHGVTFFDTAEVYGPFTNEDLVGEALAPIRDKVVVATKFGFDMDHGGALNSRPAHIRKVVEASLKRLRTDRIDLCYQHRVDPGVPIQTEYSVMNRDPECNGVLEACEELGIGFVPWGPVAMGYLTGKIDARTKLDPKTDLHSGFDRFSAANLVANQPVVDLLQRVAKKKNATPAQVALAWLLAQKPWIVPIPGMRNLAHLAENHSAVDLQLSAADLSEIDAALAAITVRGGRMNKEQMLVVDQSV